MIFEGIMNVFFALIGLVLDLLPSSDPPAWVADANDALATVWGYGSGLGAWVPWATVGAVFGSVLTCVALGFAIKVVRMVGSILTGGGGSAA